MILMTFAIILIFILVNYFKFKVKSQKLIYKHNFLFTLSRFIEKKDDIENIKDKYPHFYMILSNVYNISISNISFDDIVNKSKYVNKGIMIHLDKEFEKINKSKNTKDIELLNLYLIQNMELYFYKHPYKYEFLSILLDVSLFIPKRKIKEKVEKENIDISEYCIV